MEKCTSETIAEALEADLARNTMGSDPIVFLGRLGKIAFPELECFMTKPANIGMSVIIR